MGFIVGELLCWKLCFEAFVWNFCLGFVFRALFSELCYQSFVFRTLSSELCFQIFALRALFLGLWFWSFSFCTLVLELWFGTWVLELWFWIFGFGTLILELWFWNFGLRGTCCQSRGNQAIGVGGTSAGEVQYPPFKKLSKNPSRQSLVREILLIGTTSSTSIQIFNGYR